MGVADRDRIAIGGHSYGAFMTANLLAHSDLFRAGIARSGAYNRTLTPFGFQNERRTFWEARDIYAAMSPFFHAEKVNEPILLTHGEIDNNSGTFPVQSERFLPRAQGPRGDGALRHAAPRVARLRGAASRCCTRSRRCCAGATSTWAHRWIRRFVSRDFGRDRRRRRTGAADPGLREPQEVGPDALQWKVG